VVGESIRKTFCRNVNIEKKLTRMIGKDESSDEVTFKVADRRKFNPDGSLKEGVDLAAEKPRESEVKQPAEPARKVQAAADLPTGGLEPPAEAYDDADLEDDAEIDDPASFLNFLSTLATNAAAALGAMPHPATGQRTLDLDTGKYWLDVLAMLRDKTKGNLQPREARLLEGLLADLRMQYVQLVKATEEKLKAQAAKKFSNADILGKK
jgi:hypothetical protein